MTDEQFVQSITDGMSGGINDYLGKFECSNSDSYEILSNALGADPTVALVKAAGDAEYEKLAASIKEWFGLDRQPTTEQAKTIIADALNLSGA